MFNALDSKTFWRSPWDKSSANTNPTSFYNACLFFWKFFHDFTPYLILVFVIESYKQFNKLKLSFHRGVIASTLYLYCTLLFKKCQTFIFFSNLNTLFTPNTNFQNPFYILTLKVYLLYKFYQRQQRWSIQFMEIVTFCFLIFRFFKVDIIFTLK